MATNFDVYSPLFVTLALENGL